MTRADLEAALQNDNVRAFLRVIRAGESAQDESAYLMLFGGGLFTDTTKHPNRPITKTLGGKPITSTAAGAYQFLYRTWSEIATRYGLADFSPHSQDVGAVALIHRRGALDAVIAGRLDEALAKCAKEWASLPGSPYGQPTLTKENAREVFYLYGGTVADSSELPKGRVPMSPLVLPILQSLVPAIPALAKMFSSGSEVANRNIAAGQIIADKLVEVTQAVNLQDAAEKIQSQPEVLQAAKEAVAVAMMELGEVGGGIVKARESASDPNQVPFWRNPAVLISIAILPLVYMVAVAVLFGVGGQSWSDDIKTLLVTAIVTGVLGSVTGFFLGSSMGSQRKDSMLGGSK